jgi:glycosyltransferase involved in cell wall biosynthesis
MPARRVAIDLTKLNVEQDRPLSESLPVRFVSALIRQAPDIEFEVLARPTTCAALAPLDSPNSVRRAIREAGRLQTLLARVQRRVLQRTRAAERLAALGWSKTSPARPTSGRSGLLHKLNVDVVFCPFTDSGIGDPSVPLVAAIDDLQHLSHPYLLTSSVRLARGQAFSVTRSRAATLVCATSSLRDVALAGTTGPVKRVVVIPPGLLLAPTAATTPAVAAILARYRVVHGRFVLFAADLEARHNHRFVLTALAMWRARRPQSEIRLVCVCGPETAAASLNGVAAQMGLGHAVQFVGALDRGSITALLHGCQAVIAPSLYETIGETVLEAMQLGRPVLCSQVPGLVELTGDAAVTFDPHRPAELATVFQHLEEQPEQVERIGLRGQAGATTLGDSHSVAQAYLGLLLDAHTACRPSR